jgi:signal peptidase I
MYTEFRTDELDEANSTFREFIKFARDLVIILIIVIGIRIFFITPFRINWSSMEESYHDREYILVDKLSYLNFPSTYGAKNTTNSKLVDTANKAIGSLPISVGDPKRWDVVVITPHTDKNREYYIKRIIAIPGDTIRLESGRVYIKTHTSPSFVEIREEYLSLSNSGKTYLSESIKENQFLLGDGQYWVMWDNRQNSSDSRTCFKDCYGKDYTAHFIKRSDILGRALLNFGYFHIFQDKSWSLDIGNIGWVSLPRFLSHPRSAEYPELSGK